MIRIDALWLCTKPVDMRSGAERLLAHVVQALGCANAHHGYMFANARGHAHQDARARRHRRVAANRLNVGRFVWPREIDAAKPIALTQAQFDALVGRTTLAASA